MSGRRESRKCVARVVHQWVIDLNASATAPPSHNRDFFIAMQEGNSETRDVS